ncbi:MAG: HDIG domain-containing protein, partial [Spirochaetales bacterium]|nr:HDIG domain-containing protein [Spirochaetales bacterium]
KNNPGEVILLLILAELFFIYTLAVLKLFILPDWFNFALLIPVPLFTMVLSLVISQSAGINFAVVMSFIVLVTGNFSPYASFFALLNGISGVFCVRKTETRIDLINAGIKNGFLNIFFINTLLFFTNFDVKILLVSSGIAFINGFLSGILTLGVLPIIEHVLNSPTRFRLIELSDLNNPILKKMHSRAPGTFSHSLNVGNLAETACRAIGANPLLARVGAYYHDIGKIDQAEYFIENQKAFNKHDDLKPSMSVSVIKSHVKIGIEKAKELGLPQAVIDIIAQHHGNGLIAYFYVQALKLENKAKVTPLDYSYTEGKPRSKEAAVVLLADSVEAATRTLKKPTMSRIEKFIWQTMLSKIETDQITESELTFNDLKIIKDSFLKTIAGSFHSRIEYPDVKEAEKNEQG